MQAFKSQFPVQLQTAPEADRALADGPVVLDLTQLSQVVGGGPNGGWLTDTNATAAAVVPLPGHTW